MGLILWMFGITTFIALLVSWLLVASGACTKRECFMGSVIGYLICTCFAVVVGFVIWFASYGSYTNLRAEWDGVCLQYSQAIDLYEDKIIINTNKVFTDFRYQGHPEQVAKLITDLRNRVARYDKVFISKKKWKETFLVGAFIREPDKDMKLLAINNL